MRYVFFLLLFLVTRWVYGQFTYELDQSIPVEANGRALRLPWAGGLNAAQVNTLDINGDGKQDLVIFDRTANKILTYLNESSQYTYAPQYETLFPAEVTQWMLLRDYNCDGKKDIFTSDPFGIVVFVNTTKPGQPLSWRPFNPGFPLLTKGFSSNINLKVNESDIPSIDDVDGDGDLDILNVRFVGIGTIEWHKNLSMERTGTCDSLQLERVTQNFGGFEECSCGSFAFSGQTCDDLSGGRVQHAGGKTMLMLDLDHDGDRELLFSEESCTRTYLLRNDGTAANAVMNSSSDFPAANPVNFQIFPAVYYEDLDFDGVPDLVASPNTYARTAAHMDLANSLWLYKNTGTVQLPQFTFQKSNFLQEEMIDVGDYAIPSFFDYDGDGDQDFFISNYAGAGFIGSVYLYQNTGTSSEPQFKFITDDFAGLSLAGYYNIKLQFADINGDSTFDFVFTATNPFSNITSLFYVANQSTTRLDFTGQYIQPTGFNIAQAENILLVDVDQDGRKDILLGKGTGAVQYWHNQGPAGQFNFVMENNAFLGLGSSTERQSPALSAGDLDGDGRAELIVSDQRGKLTVYGDFRAQDPAIVGVQDILHNPLTDLHEAKNLGGRNWTVPVNLYGTTRPLLVVGTTLGGIYILKNDGGELLPEEPRVELFPNPVKENEVMKIRTDRNVLVEFYTAMGQRVSETYFIPANQEYPMRFSGLAAGIYIARFTSDGKTIGKRFIIN